MRVKKQMRCDIYVRTFFFDFEDLSILTCELAGLVADRHLDRVT